MKQHLKYNIDGVKQYHTYAEKYDDVRRRKSMFYGFVSILKQTKDNVATIYLKKYDTKTQHPNARISAETLRGAKIMTKLQ